MSSWSSYRKLYVTDFSEIPPDHLKYTASSLIHEAGFDSFVTAKVLTRLAAKIDGQHVLPSVPDGAKSTAETAVQGNGATGSDLEESIGAVKTSEDSLTSTDQNPKPSIMSPINNVNPFAALSLEEANSPFPSTETRLMMPPSDSHFWSTYGNKLRVNGTLEEVCIIETRDSRPLSSHSFDGIKPPGFWVA